MLHLLWPLPAHYICPQTDAPLVIDGRLDEAAWDDAEWTSLFIDIEGDVKPRPRHATRVKMLWDQTYFYVAATLEEPHLWATLTKRDSIIFHDNDFEVFLNPSNDNHHYYELEVNVFNTVWDLYLSKPYRDGVRADHDWTLEGLVTAVTVDGTINDPTDTDTSWTVEIAMPWSAFDLHASEPIAPNDGDIWRVNFSRVQWDLNVVEGGYEKIKDRPEYNWVWTPQGAINMHRPERWGYVQFTTDTDVERTRDESHPVRVYLHEVYYEQKRRREAEGAYTFNASNIEQAVAPHRRSELIGPLRIEKNVGETAGGNYIAYQDIMINGQRETWFIRHDSKIGRVESR